MGCEKQALKRVITGICPANRPRLYSGMEKRSIMIKKKKPHNPSKWSDAAVETFARCVWPDILVCFESEEGQREFAEWQRERARKAADKQSKPEKAA